MKGFKSLTMFVTVCFLIGLAMAVTMPTVSTATDEDPCNPQCYMDYSCGYGHPLPCVGTCPPPDMIPWCRCYANRLWLCDPETTQYDCRCVKMGCVIPC